MTYYRIIESELKKYSLSWKYKGNLIFHRGRGAVRDPITCVLQEKRIFYPRYIRVIDVRLGFFCLTIHYNLTYC